MEPTTRTDRNPPSRRVPLGSLSRRLGWHIRFCLVLSAIAWIRLTLWSDAPASAMPPVPATAAGDRHSADELVRAARAAGREGDLATARQLLLDALEQYEAQPDADRSAVLTARLGVVSAAWQLRDYMSVIAHSERLLESPATIADTQTRVGVMQMLAKSYSASSRYNDSLRITQALAGQSDIARSLAAEHSLVIGGAALRGGEADVATTAYQFYLATLPDGSRVAEAELGIAWAAVLGGQADEQAERLLGDFIANHPQHRDVPPALAARATVLQRLGRTAEATAIQLAILENHPTATVAAPVLESWVTSQPAPWPPTVTTLWKQRLADTDTHAHPLPAAVLASLFAGSLQTGDDSLWQSAIAALVATDQEGVLTWEVLESLALSTTSATTDDPVKSNVHVAERLAIGLLGRLIDASKGTADSPLANRPSDPSPQSSDQAPQSIGAACQAACRWVGSSGRWSMLAMLADELAIPDRDHPVTLRRGVAIDRMIAESLMQTHRGVEALPWWLAIAEVWQCDDFPTLIRTAETAVAFGSLAEASARLEAAKQSAGDDGFKVSLTRMLDAELAIRRARLDEAREVLAVMVRAAETTTELRPRAQWLIGETYFLQQKYAEAIDAYRRVDTLDPSGQWAALALLQAGKAFENLARPREAATCYTALLTRFADLPHADHARTRLAQLGGETPLRR